MSTTNLGIGRHTADIRLRLSLHHLTRWFLYGTLILCALIELPARVTVGPVSGLAVLTILITVVAWALWLLYPTTGHRAWVTMLPFMLLLIWAFFMALIHGITVAGAQNLVVLMGFLGLSLLSAHLARLIPRFWDKIYNTVQRAAVIALALTIASLIGRNLHIAPMTLVSGRVAALYLFIPTAFFLGEWRYGRSRWAFWVAMGLGVVSILTLSRMASAVILCQFVAAQWKPGRKGQWLRVLFWGILIAVAAALLLQYYEPLRQRMFGSDAVLRIGNVSINAMGRLTFWTYTIESWLESPWLGKGPGSWSRETGILIVDHPHNDYLRILHDYGVVGLALFLWSLSAIFARLWRAWMRSSKLRQPEAKFYFAGLLALGSFLIAMLTDNPLVYMFLMAPLGIIVGTALGISQRTWFSRPPQTAKAAVA